MTEIILIIANILLSIYGAISYFENGRLQKNEKKYQEEIDRKEKAISNHKIEISKLRKNVDSLTKDNKQTERFLTHKGFSKIEITAWALNELQETRRKNIKASMTNKKFKSDEDAYEYYRKNCEDTSFDTFMTLGLIYMIADDSSSKSSSSYDYNSGSSWTDNSDSSWSSSSYDSNSSSSYDSSSSSWD